MKSSHHITEHRTLESLAAEKRLRATAFTESNMKLTDPLAKHVAWAYNHIYYIAYPITKISITPSLIEGLRHNIKRRIHGITHVTRAAFYIYPWANLYRRYGDEEALKLTDEDIHLIQLAVLFHDSAREDEGEDLWDKDSAELLYHYLTVTLKVPNEKAIVFAEAVANKDADDCYFELKVENGKAHWIQSEKRPKTIIQKLIHDADCLDIIRARPHFDGTYLDFYKDIASKQPQALDEMAQFIMEARSLIVQHGDYYFYPDIQCKKRFEHHNAYMAIEKTIIKQEQKDVKQQHKDEITLFEKWNRELLGEWGDFSAGTAADNDPRNFYRILPHYHGRLLTLDELKKSMLVDNNPLKQGKVLARSVPMPSAQHDKHRESKTLSESLVQVEIRKLLRRPGIETRSKKPGNKDKYGNPHRSTSMIGYSLTYSGSGFLIIDPDLKAIENVSQVDSSTGFSKKKRCEYLSLEQEGDHTQEQLDDLLKKEKLGESSTNGRHTTLTFNEILYHVTYYDAIYYSNDPNVKNKVIFSVPTAHHLNTPALEAIYMQNEYLEKAGKILPIYEYSGIHNYFIKRAWRDDEIVSLWREVVKQRIEKEIENNNYDVLTMTVDEFKIQCTYGKIGPKNDAYVFRESLDSNYSNELKLKINTMIEAVQKNKHKELFEELKKMIQDASLKDDLLLKKSVFKRVMYYASYISAKHELKHKITRKLSYNLLSDSLFGGKGEVPGIPDITYQGTISKLINDKENFLKSREGGKLIESNPLFIIYLLARQLNLSFVTDEIQNRIIKKLEDMNFSYNFDTLKEVLLCASFFDIRQKLSVLIDSISDQVLVFSSLRYFDKISMALHQYGLLNQGRLMRGAFIVGALFDNFMSWVNKSYIPASFIYLTLAKIYKLPLDEVKKILVQLLSHPSNHEFLQDQDAAFIRLLHEMSLLKDNVIFELLLKRVKGTDEAKIAGSLETSKYIFQEYRLYEKRLRKLFPGNLLTEEQKSMIAQLKDAELINSIKKMANCFEQKIEPGSFRSVLERYLMLTKEANYPIEQQQVDIVTLLNHTQRIPKLTGMDPDLLEIIRRYPVLQASLEIFKLFIKKMTSEEFNKQIKLLEYAMPNKKFTAEQSKIVEQFKNEKSADQFKLYRQQVQDDEEAAPVIFHICSKKL